MATSSEKEETFLDSPSKQSTSNNANVKSTTSSTRTISPTILESIGHYLQRVALQNQSPLTTTFFSLFLYPIIWLFSIIQGVRANQATYLYRKYKVFGTNFCCAGGVWISDFQSVRSNLLQPQARTKKLAPSTLDGAHLPHVNLEGDGRLTFLLALSQESAGGDGTYEGFRQAFVDFITSSSSTNERLSDGTTQSLLEKMVAEYNDMGGHSSKAFFKDNDLGLHDFILRYLHYVLFGLDPNDDEIMGVLNKLHYDSISATYYLKVCVPSNSRECLCVYLHNRMLFMFECHSFHVNNNNTHTTTESSHYNYNDIDLLT